MSDAKIVKGTIEEEELAEDELESEEDVEEASSHEDRDEVPAPLVQDQYGYEYTLAIIKPHAIQYVPIIERTILEKGFTIILKKTMKLMPEQAAEFFMKREKHDPVKVPRLVCHMVSGPTQVMVLARRQAIRQWQHLMGPADPCKAKLLYPLSLRAKYGRDEERNALYGSRDQEEAAKDIRFFFKDVIIEPSTTTKSADIADPCSSYLSDRLYLQKYVYPTLQKGLAELVRRKPPEPYQWFIDWLIENDPSPPKLEPRELQDVPN